MGWKTSKTELLNLHSNRRQTRGSKMSEIEPKKMVRRSVAIALGIICIILIAGLGVTMEYYTMAINDKSNAIASLTDTVNLAKFLVLADNQTVTQTAGNYTSWTFTANATGYVSVWGLSSTTNNTYVRVIYNASVPTPNKFSSYQTNYQWVYQYEDAFSNYQYDNQVNGEKAFSDNIFPVFPTIVEIRVGNTNIIGNATERVLIVYYY
jgi:hypothetical protein